MEVTILKNGKTIAWSWEFASSEGITVIVGTGVSLNKEEKKEFKRKVKHERDVVDFLFL